MFKCNYYELSFATVRYIEASNVVSGIFQESRSVLWLLLPWSVVAPECVTFFYVESVQLPQTPSNYGLTHWGRAKHICASKLTRIGWDNGLSPGRSQAIIWINVGLLPIETLGTNFSEIFSEMHFIQENTFENAVCEMAAVLSRPQCVSRIVVATNRKSYVSRCYHVNSAYLLVWLCLRNWVWLWVL